jgi:Flp pilus assembly pilin Flp
MPRIATRFIRDERGEDVIEYGLLVAFLASLALAAVISDPVHFRDALLHTYQRASDALNQT